MKIEDPLSPSGDQPDLNKLRRTEQTLCVLGRKRILCPFQRPGLLLQGEAVGGVHRDPCLGGGHGSCVTWPPESPRVRSFIGAAGWVSANWSRGWRAGSCRWGPAGRGGRAADRPRWHPLSQTRRCCPSGRSAARDTQSGHSGTPGKRGEAVSVGWRLPPGSRSPGELERVLCLCCRCREEQLEGWESKWADGLRVTGSVVWIPIKRSHCTSLLSVTLVL